MTPQPRFERGRQEAAAYGLEAPRVRIAVSLAGGTELRVAVGETTGTDGITFLRGPDETVVIVSAEAGEGLVRAAREVLRAGSGAPVPAPAPP